MQQLRDKLAIADRAAKSEAQMKVRILVGMHIALVFFMSLCMKALIRIAAFCLSQEKFQLRLRVLEESLRGPSSSGNRSTPEGRSISNGPSRRQSLGGADIIPKLTSNGFFSKRTPSSQFRSLNASTSTILKHAKGTSRSFDGGSRSLDRSKLLTNKPGSKFPLNQSSEGTSEGVSPNSTKQGDSEKAATTSNDSVPGVLHDLLQKEVITLRKAAHDKDQSLRDKDEAIEVSH